LSEQTLPHPQLLLAVAALEERARAADSLNGLAFSIANDPYPLLGFRQALVFAAGETPWTLLAVSGLARPTEDSPYLVWLRRAADWLAGLPKTEAAAWITPDIAGIPADITEGWQEWWPAGLWCLRLVDRNSRIIGMAVFLLDAPPAPPIADQLTRLAGSWGYCWAALVGNRPRWRLKLTPRQRKLALAAAAGLFLIPVKQTALAPAEVVSQDALVVASPLDGVVKTFHVAPNQPVRKGEKLFSLDDTTLRNRLEVGLKSVGVADAELNAASQRAFDNIQTRNEIALLTGRAEERRAELASIQAQLTRIEVLAPRDGVAVFGDTNDWIGKPVSTGERILLLADPAQPAMLINLPVADAIALDVGAPVKLYLTTHPLSSLDGRITETSYQALTTPDGIAAYRLRATFDGRPEEARLGLRGTAKVYGDWVVLGYYLLRRPLAALREWSGL
jgi:multidrug resistance efflux pump